MTEDAAPEQGELEILRVGDRLRMAREGAGLSIADIANRTRITQRHLAALERSDFDDLPGRTYISGFARAYARAVDLSEADIARDIRSELDSSAMGPREHYEAYEPADPDRVPPNRLVWTVLGAVVLLAIAYGTWRSFTLDTTVEPRATSAVVAAGDKQDAEAATANLPDDPGVSAKGNVPANAVVVLSASADSRDGVWVGFDDSDGKTENWRTLDPGEELVVPADYLEKFTLRTAKPQLLRVTINGREVGPIGPADTLVKNVSLKPADLMARAGAAAAPAAASAQRQP